MKLTLTVPMDKIRQHGSIEFEMVFHVASRKFEEVRMFSCETREHLGKAHFTVEQPRGRGASSDAVGRVNNPRAAAMSSAAAAGHRGRSVAVAKAPFAARGAAGRGAAAAPASVAKNVP